jgi:hypothetical protein
LKAKWLIFFAAFCNVYYLLKQLIICIKKISRVQNTKKISWVQNTKKKSFILQKRSDLFYCFFFLIFFFFYFWSFSFESFFVYNNKIECINLYMEGIYKKNFHLHSLTEKLIGSICSLALFLEFWRIKLHIILFIYYIFFYVKNKHCKNCKNIIKRRK